MTRNMIENRIMGTSLVLFGILFIIYTIREYRDVEEVNRNWRGYAIVRNIGASLMAIIAGIALLLGLVKA